MLSAMQHLSSFSDVQEAACFALGALCVNNGTSIINLWKHLCVISDLELVCQFLNFLIS